MSWPRFDNPRDVSVTPQTMSGLPGAPAAPLHRQYKTARTETRWHLLLKIGQMPTQTSASRGYVLFSGVDKGHTPKPLNCLRSAATFRGVLKTWKDTDHRGCQTRCGLEIPDFAIRMTVSGCVCETSENFYIIRALFPAASAFGGMFIPLYLCSWYLREGSASCQYRGSHHL